MARSTPGRVALALLFVPLLMWSPAAASHGDDAEVVYEWNAILERSLATTSTICCSCRSSLSGSRGRSSSVSDMTLFY